MTLHFKDKRICVIVQKCAENLLSAKVKTMLCTFTNNIEKKTEFKIEITQN